MASIESLKAKLSKLEASSHFDTLLPKTSGWLSRKLLILLAVLAGMIYLGRDNLSLSSVVRSP